METNSAKERDWVEDFQHENGNYCNVCIRCGLEFMGHKRRVICKSCQSPKPEDSAKEYTDNEAIAEFMGWKRGIRESDKAVYYKSDHMLSNSCFHFKFYFESSWDWLMPAVKKWNDLVVEKRKQKHGWTKWQYMTVMLSTDINKLHKDLIEALKWHNNQTSK